MSECADIYAAISRLEAKIDVIQRIDEEAIAERGAQKAQQRLDPTITAATITAGGAAALGRQALAKILAFLGSLASLEILVAAAVAAASLVYILQSQVGSLSSRVGNLESKVSGILQTLDAVKGSIKRLFENYYTLVTRVDNQDAKIQAAYDFANLAYQRSNKAIQEANTATRTANQAREEANRASLKANAATEKANQAIGGVNQLRPQVDLAIRKAEAAQFQAEFATGAANYAADLANGATIRANRAADKAGAAELRANNAADKAGAAELRANRAADKAGAAELRADTAYLIADRAISRANDAINKANQLTTQIQPIDTRIKRAESKSDQALGVATKTNGLIVHYPKIWEPRIYNQTIKTIQTVVPISIADASRQIERNFEQGRQAVANQQTFLAREIVRLDSTITGIRPVSLNDIDRRIANNPTITSLQKAVPTIETKVNNLERGYSRDRTMNNQALKDFQKTLQAIPAQTASLIKTPSTTQIEDALKPAIAAVPLGVAALVLPRLPSLAQIKTVAKEATCEESRPGGCLGKPLNNLQNGQNSILQGLDAATQTGQGVILNSIWQTTNTINRKLGAEIPGLGIGGKLTNFVNWAFADRVMNMVTMLAAVHNVFMLSNSIQSTFFSSIDNILQIGAYIQNPDGTGSIDSRSWLSENLDSFFSGLFGATEWTAVKGQWKAFSTISNASAQALNNLREIHNDSQELLNMSRNYTAQLGNALVDEGVISEDNWDYKDPNQRIKSKALGRLERMGRGLEVVDESLQAVEMITAIALNITQTANEIKENIDTINNAVTAANTAAATDRNATIEGLELPNFTLEDLY